MIDLFINVINSLWSSFRYDSAIKTIVINVWRPWLATPIVQTIYIYIHTALHNFRPERHRTANVCINDFSNLLKKNVYLEARIISFFSGKYEVPSIYFDRRSYYSFSCGDDANRSSILNNKCLCWAIFLQIGDCRALLWHIFHIPWSFGAANICCVFCNISNIHNSIPRSRQMGFRVSSNCYTETPTCHPPQTFIIL